MMSKEEILAEHGILTYSQRLEIKGVMEYKFNDGNIVNTAMQIYGTVLNAQTLAIGEVVSIKGVKRIVTIENKANYEDMDFDEGTLYIFCHGFFSPKERRFLSQLIPLAEPNVVFQHWGDMDYGGIQIYNFIKRNLFPELQPIYMNRETYEEALNCNAGYEISDEKYKKLEEMNAGDLEDLKNCILERKMEVEQEVVIAKKLRSVNMLK